MTHEEKHIAEYLKYDKSERLNYWERYFYWDFKSSYKDENIDHFNYSTLLQMRKMDPNFDEIQEEVILNFVKFISDGNDKEILEELKNNLKLNG